jgi:hypothetical protein
VDSEIGAVKATVALYDRRLSTNPQEGRSFELFKSHADLGRQHPLTGLISPLPSFRAHTEKNGNMFDRLREKAAAHRDEKGRSDEAVPPPVYTTTASSSSAGPFQTRFASLSMHMNDRLRFLRFPAPVINECRSTVLGTWKKGIQEERLYGNSHEFKLHGYPWSTVGEEAVDACRLVAAMLAALHSQGWVLTLNADVSTNASDKDTLLFRHQVPSPAPCEWCSITFSRNDRLRFVGDCVEVYQDLSTKLGPQWIKSYDQRTPGVHEIKFHGFPWAATGKETMKARELLLVLLETLEEQGWTVYASIDQHSEYTGANRSSTDTVSFEYP